MCGNTFQDALEATGPSPDVDAVRVFGSRSSRHIFRVARETRALPGVLVDQVLECVGRQLKQAGFGVQQTSLAWHLQALYILNQSGNLAS